MALTCQFIDKKTLENGTRCWRNAVCSAVINLVCSPSSSSTRTRIQARFIKTTYEATSIWEKATCFMVKKDVPLGYLNLREGPGMEFKARDKLAPRQDQLAAMVQTKDGKWTRVIRENGDEVAMEGWVYQGFLDEVECKPGALPSAVSEPPAPPKVRVLSSLPDNASGALPGHEYAEVSMLATPGRTVLDKDSRYLGGKVLEHAVYFRAVAMGGDNVEVRTGCPSACATLMAYIPKERICFAQGSWLGFHLVRAGRDGAPRFEITKWLIDGFPNDIQTWINQRGGLNMWPYRDVWTLHAEGSGKWATAGAEPEP